jgi:DNA ligase (NAD+)
MNDKPLRYKYFVLTGKLSTVRAEATAAIERLGGTVQSSVTNSTTYLVAGDKVGMTKMDAARRKGAQVISEDTLLKMIGS